MFYSCSLLLTMHDRDLTDYVIDFYQLKYYALCIVLQYKRPCCFMFTTTSRRENRRVIVDLRKHGRECCQLLTTRLHLNVHFSMEMKSVLDLRLLIINIQFFLYFPYESNIDKFYKMKQTTSSYSILVPLRSLCFV